MSASKIDWQSLHWLKLRAFTAIPKTCLKHLISSMYPGATSMCLRRLCFAATLAWTPWWLAEPSDLAAHTLVHTLGIRDNGPSSFLNPAFSCLPQPPPIHSTPLTTSVLTTACLHRLVFFLTPSFIARPLALPPPSSSSLFLSATGRWVQPRLLCAEWLFIECHAGR